MNDYWVFLFPAGGDRADAIEGHILCPMIEVSAVSDEAIVEAFPHACRIMRLRGTGGDWVFVATATPAAA